MLDFIFSSKTLVLILSLILLVLTFSSKMLDFIFSSKALVKIFLFDNYLAFEAFLLFIMIPIYFAIFFPASSYLIYFFTLIFTNIHLAQRVIILAA